MKINRYIISISLLLLLIQCTVTNPITGQQKLPGFTAHLTGYTRDSNNPDIFYLKMVIGMYADEKEVQDIYNYECNKIAQQFDYSYYKTVDANLIDDGFQRYQLIEVEFYKSEPYNPCEDEIFSIARDKGLLNMTEREMEVYKLKVEECNENKAFQESRRQASVDRKIRASNMQLILGLIGVLLLLYTWTPE